MEVFKASPRDRAQQQFVEQNMLTLLLMVEIFTASPRDRALQRYVAQITSTFPFLMVVLEREVFMVFSVDRVPQRQPSSRLFLRLLIDLCHEPRFMAVMTSGCV